LFVNIVQFIVVLIVFFMFLLPRSWFE